MFVQVDCAALGVDEAAAKAPMQRSPTLCERFQRAEAERPARNAKAKKRRFLRRGPLMRRPKGGASASQGPDAGPESSDTAAEGAEGAGGTGA